MSERVASFQTLLQRATLTTTSEPDQLVVECLEAMLKLEKEGAKLDDGKLAATVSLQIVLPDFFGKADLTGVEERLAMVIAKLKRFTSIAERHKFILGFESLMGEADHAVSSMP